MNGSLLAGEFPFCRGPAGGPGYHDGVAKPYRGSLIKELERAQEHVKDLAAALRSLKARLDSEGIAFAVIGALAVQKHGFWRFTEDIDLLTTPEGLDRIHQRFGGRGLNPRGPGLRKKLRDSEHEVNVDVITSGEHAGAAGSPIVYPEPTSDWFVEEDGIRYPTLQRLIEIKLASHLWGHRAHDLADIVRLIQHHKLDRAFAQQLHPALRAKFIEAVETAGLERDIE